MNRLFAAVDDHMLVEVWTDPAGIRASLTFQLLDLPAGMDDPITVLHERVVEVLLRQGLALNGAKDVLRGHLAMAITKGETLHRVPLLEGKSPGSGRDGHVEWRPDGRTAPGVSLPDPLIRVAGVPVGATLARVHESTDGPSGEDVFGRRIPGGRGRSVRVIAGDGVVSEDERRPSAAGVRILRAGRAGLAVWRRVDGADGFEVIPCRTLDQAPAAGGAFDGALWLAGDLENAARLDAVQGILVEGSVSGGRVSCEGWVAIGGGVFPGSDVVARGNVSARSLVGASVRVGGDLRVETEIRLSKVRVLGSLAAPAACVVGGELSVLGGMDVRTIGSERGSPCLVSLNSTDLQEAIETLFRLRLRRIDERRAQLSLRREAIQKRKDRLTAQEKEELTLHQAEEHGLDAERKSLLVEKRDMIVRLRSKESMELVFRESLYAGVEIQAAGRSWLNRERRVGPGRLVFDQNRGVALSGLSERGEA